MLKNGFINNYTNCKFESEAEVHLEDTEEITPYPAEPSGNDLYSWGVTGVHTLIALVGSFYSGPPTYTMSCRRAPRTNAPSSDGASCSSASGPLPPRNGSVVITHQPPGWRYKASAILLKVDTDKRAIPDRGGCFDALPRGIPRSSCAGKTSVPDTRDTWECSLKEAPPGRR